jgi:hypothetical protein
VRVCLCGCVRACARAYVWCRCGWVVCAQCACGTDLIEPLPPKPPVTTAAFGAAGVATQRLRRFRRVRTAAALRRRSCVVFCSYFATWVACFTAVYWGFAAAGALPVEMICPRTRCTRATNLNAHACACARTHAVTRTARRGATQACTERHRRARTHGRVHVSDAACARRQLAHHLVAPQWLSSEPSHSVGKSLPKPVEVNAA